MEALAPVAIATLWLLYVATILYLFTKPRGWYKASEFRKLESKYINPTKQMIKGTVFVFCSVPIEGPYQKENLSGVKMHAWMTKEVCKLSGCKNVDFYTCWRE